MSKIEFLPIGGINERGNNCYALIIEEEIIIVNCGIYIPTTIKLGIKKYIPDFNFLKENKDKIVGIVIGEPKESNFGSLNYLINALGKKEDFNIPIYVSETGEERIAQFLSENGIDEVGFAQVKASSSTKIGSNVLTPFRTYTMFPNSFGFVIKTKTNENIIFIDEFIITSERTTMFQNQILTINNITQNKNDILILGINNIDKMEGFVAPKHTISNTFENILADKKGKIIIATYEDDVYKITQLLKMCYRENLPVCFTNENTRQFIDFLIETNYIKEKNIKFINPSDISKHSNVAIFLTYQPQVLSNKIEDLLVGKIDGNDEEITEDLILFNENDTFCFYANTVNGFERQQADMFDEVSKYGINVSDFRDSVLPVAPGDEDYKLLISVIQPTYIIPISCLYMEYVKFIKLIATTGFNLENVVNSANGSFTVFTNGVLEKKGDKKIKIEPQLINNVGNVDNDISSVYERNAMKESGVVLVSLLIDPSERKIKKSNFDQVGVVSPDFKITNTITEMNKEFVNKINNLLLLIDNVNEANMRTLKQNIRKVVCDKYKKNFNKEPVVLTTIINSNNNIKA